MLGIYLGSPQFLFLLGRNQEFASLDSEGAFFQVESHVVFSSLFEHSLEMGDMINLLLGFDNHVVHVDLKDVTEQCLVIDFVHHSLISCPRIP